MMHGPINIKDNLIVNVNVISNIEQDFNLEVAIDIFHDLAIPV